MLESIHRRVQGRQESDKQEVNPRIPCLAEPCIDPNKTAIIIESPYGVFTPAIVDEFMVSFNESPQPGRLVNSIYRGAKVIKSDKESVTVDLLSLRRGTEDSELTLPRSFLIEE